MASAWYLPEFVVLNIKIMSEIKALILGIIQGITEFLPVSSSGHLVIFEDFLNLDVEALKSFDVVVHMGTFLAIIIYFFPIFKKLFTAAVSYLPFLKSKKNNADRKLIKLLLIGTIPAVIAGFLLEDTIDYYFRDPKIIMILMFILGLVFLLVERKSNQKQKDVNKYSQSLIIGLSQAIALLPGISRSGSTIATGLMLGIKREKAAEFSFLLGSIAIFGAGLLTALKTIKSGEMILPWSIYLIGFISSFISGYFSIKFLMKYLQNHTLKIFAYYLILFSIINFFLNITS